MMTRKWLSSMVQGGKEEIFEQVEPEWNGDGAAGLQQREELD